MQKLLGIVCLLVGLSKIEAQPGGAQCWGDLLPNTYLYLYPNGYSYRTNMDLVTAQTECLSNSDCGGVTSRGNTNFWECRKGKTPNTNSQSGERSYIRNSGCNANGCTPGTQANNCNMKCTCYSGTPNYWVCLSTCPPHTSNCGFVTRANPSYPTCCPIEYCEKPQCWSAQLANRYLYGYPPNYVVRPNSLTQAKAECMTIPQCGGITKVTSGSNAGYWECRVGPNPNNSPTGETSIQRLTSIAGCTSATFLEMFSNQTMNNNLLQFNEEE
jgi:hypothetical protein